MGIAECVRAELVASGKLDSDLVDYVVQVAEEGEDQVKNASSLCALIGEHLTMYEAVNDDKQALALCQKMYSRFSQTHLSAAASSSSCSAASALSAPPPLLSAPVNIAQEEKKLSALALANAQEFSSPSSAAAASSSTSTTAAANTTENKKKGKLSEGKKKGVVTIKTAETTSKNALLSSSTSTTSTTSSSAATKKKNRRESKKNSTNKEEEEEGVEEEDEKTGERGGEEEEEIDDTALVPQRLESYFQSGEWKGEMKVKPPAQYTSAELATFVRRGGKGARQEEGWSKFAGVLEADEVTGALLLAGGVDQLADRGQNFVHRDKGVVKTIAREIFAALEKEQKRALATTANANSSYFDFYGEPLAREADQMVSEEFKSSELKNPLRRALMVYTAESIRYSHLRASDITTLDVNSVHRRVTRVLQSQALEQFKVVSVSAFPWHDVIQKNFIFFKSTKDGKSRWEPLASVDFDQHGAAPPGHWHLNRAPDGDVMQHWGPHINKTFHGDPAKCPLWWLLIPEHFRYKNKPDRLN